MVILTVHADEDYLFQTLRFGASGYVLKSSADTELMDAIRTAHRGEVFLYPAMAGQLGNLVEPGSKISRLPNRQIA